MKPFIVVSDGFDKSLFESLKKIAELEVHPESKLTPEGLDILLPKINGLIIRSATKVDVNLLEKAPNLKIVIRAGEGTDNIDKKSCALKGVKVANTPGANNNSAAEHAIALMFSVLRKTAASDASMKQGKWDKDAFTGLEVWKKKIGIVGFGRIGQIVATRLSGFEPDVLFYDPFVEKSPMSYAKKATLEDIFSQCDIISIHTPLMPETKNLINESLLNKMKKTAVLINAARGGIVDEAALVKVLSENKIKGAGVDVFATEPLPSENPFKNLSNVVLSPHVGASTEEAQFRVGEMAVHQIKEFFVNSTLLNEVKAK
jgi:D-3-phosphoglycerate dehydrogenase